MKRISFVSLIISFLISVLAFGAENKMRKIAIAAEEFGDEIIKAMKSRGIKWVAFKGSVDSALKKVLKSTTGGKN